MERLSDLDKITQLNSDRRWRYKHVAEAERENQGERLASIPVEQHFNSMRE